MIIKGSCCCGGVRFELFEPPALMGTCHCSRCRKAGSSTYVFVRAEAFSWTAGRDLVTRYRPRPPFRFVRAFCRRCGSALGDPGNGRVFAIAANCLDDDPGIRTGFHEYTPDKPPWREGFDDP
ncbi:MULTISPECIES: GFA family protein [Caulobacter]|uniref:GFA family protein n=1 Tax=Caulobacter TaxID=75 RepID=UPI0009D9C2BC|nr:GFA family protein [Caulobacter vibrioides]MBQ1559961.1 GFA family protein [Caulobacter sp.]